MLPKGGPKVSLAKKKDATTTSSTVHVGIVRSKHDANHLIHKIVGWENQPSFIVQTKHECKLLILAWEH